MDNNSKKKGSSNADSLFENMWGDDSRLARSAISRIRNEGRLQDIPGIIKALRLQKKEAVRKEIHALLCDIQIVGMSKYIIGAIMDPQNNKILAELLSVCWESKQDFTPHLDVFTSIFLNEDYITSIEAFTIIEKIFLDYDMPQQKLQATINLIKTSYPDLTENKRDLALVLLDTLEGQKEQ